MILFRPANCTRLPLNLKAIDLLAERWLCFGEVGPSICSDDFVFQQKLKMLDPAEGVPPAAKLRKQLRFRANWNCGFIQEICFRRAHVRPADPSDLAF